MVHATLESYERKGLIRPHRMISDLGNRRDVFIRRQAWNEVIELKDEPDMLPAVEGQATVIELGEVEILEEDRAAGGRVEPSHDVQERRLAAGFRMWAGMRIRLPTKHHLKKM